MKTDMQKKLTKKEQPTLNMWAVYGICLLISSVFFFLFGLNSPIFAFNQDIDYNWFVTVGHGLVAGKMPYRDLFEQKGPIVYLTTAFCCLFSNPNTVMLLIEIFSMSLFFFFTYRIARKRLNNFYSLIAVIIMATAIFTSWCRCHSAATVEEFMLPIYTYFFLCWLEFLLEKRGWSWIRALCLGLCFGIMIWVKYTLVYFMIVPMISWLILNLRNKSWRNLIMNLVLMLAGVVIITLPNLIFFAVNHALTDLFRVYFLINLTAYGTTSISMVLLSFSIFFLVGPLILCLILWGVIRLSIRHWRRDYGKLILTSFLVTLALLSWSAKTSNYYFSELIPYATLGINDLLILISSKLTLPKWRKHLFILITVFCIIICIPFSLSAFEWGRDRNDYTPIVIANEIHAYEAQTNRPVTLFCYKIYDFGFYNAAGVVPNTYFFAKNVFSVDRFPQMYNAFHNYITEQTCDFVVTERSTWDAEKDFLSQYYEPFHNNDIEASTYYYRKMHYFYYRNHCFVLLIKKN